MLSLLSELSDGGDFFNLFRYITFRAGGAFFTSLALSFFFGRRVINYLKMIQKRGQPIRDDGPESHIIAKAGTPTMGGVLIFSTLLIASILWAKPSVGYVWMVLFVTTGFFLIGFADDYAKLSAHSTKGLSAKLRILLGCAISAIAGYWVMILQGEGLGGYLSFPVFKDFMVNLGWLFIPFAVVVILGAANSVNFTDGLDGLAIMPVMIASASFALIVYLVGRFDYSEYLGLNYVEGVGELVIICAAMIGAGLGFLWYNAPPAAVFMGDTGSLALGGLLGAMALASKHEIVLAIIGGIFVVETLSVIIQVAYYKRTKKRIFLMAPIHHHFEKKGWGEAQIVIRFWIISLVLALVGLATLKIR